MTESKRSRPTETALLHSSSPLRICEIRTNLIAADLARVDVHGVVDENGLDEPLALQVADGLTRQAPVHLAALGHDGRRDQLGLRDLLHHLVVGSLGGDD